MRFVELVMLAHPFREPLLLATLCLRVAADREGFPHDVFVADAGDHQRRVLGIELAIGFVAHDEAVALVIDDEAFGYALDRLDQPRVGAFRLLQLAIERNREQRYQDQQRQHAGGGEDRFFAPFGKNRLGRGRDRQNQRQIAELLIDEKSLASVDLARRHEVTRALAGETLEDVRLAEILPDIRLVIGQAHHNGTVGAEERYRGVRVEIDGLEKPFEITEAQRSEDHPGEAAIRSLEPAAEGDRPWLLDEPRPIGRADIEVGVLLVALNLKVIAVGKIRLARWLRARIEDDVAVFVENEDRAEVCGVGGTIEKDFIANSVRRAPDPRRVQALDHRAKGEVVNFNVALDVMGEGRDQIFGALDGVSFGDAAGVPNRPGGEGDDPANRGCGADQDYPRRRLKLRNDLNRSHIPGIRDNGNAWRAHRKQPILRSEWLKISCGEAAAGCPIGPARDLPGAGALDPTH